MPTTASAALQPTWTPDRVSRAMRLYLVEGFTASEVAEALGGGLSRGAVVGKIRRLGFLKREVRHSHASLQAPSRAAPKPAEPNGACHPVGRQSRCRR